MGMVLKPIIYGELVLYKWGLNTRDSISWLEEKSRFFTAFRMTQPRLGFVP